MAKFGADYDPRLPRWVDQRETETIETGGYGAGTQFIVERRDEAEMCVPPLDSEYRIMTACDRLFREGGSLRVEKTRDGRVRFRYAFDGTGDEESGADTERSPYDRRQP